MILGWVAVTAVAVNHRGIQLANESAAEGFSRCRPGSKASGRTSRHCQVLLCFNIPQSRITQSKRCEMVAISCLLEEAGFKNDI